MDNYEEIKTYNDAELVNLVLLAQELRKRLDLVGLRPGRWDGPGAVATALMKRERVSDALSRQNSVACPDGAADAARTAYAGGRFEVVRFGSVNRPGYEYDRNSAYPHALQHVPCLAHGHWIHHPIGTGICEGDFSVYHLRYRGPQGSRPGPLFLRMGDGTINYPGDVDGWYWKPETEAAQDYVKNVEKRAKLEILESWEWIPEPQDCPNPYPFDFIPGLYRKRQALKRAGDGAHVGIKLALNSLYGKLAQQVGWKRTVDGELRIPPYHELAWAGYTTSHCRAAMLRAAMLDIDAVIAFETDAIFTSKPLDLPLGAGLGEWSLTEFDSLTYVQSGVYFGELTGQACTCDTDTRRRCKRHHERTRGANLGSVHQEDFALAMLEPLALERSVNTEILTFHGAGRALAGSWDKWCTWEMRPRQITAEPPENSKRNHLGGCSKCWEGLGGSIRPDVWHTTTCPAFAQGVKSMPYPIAWINPDEHYRIQVALADAENAGDENE